MSEDPIVRVVEPDSPEFGTTLTEVKDGWIRQSCPDCKALFIQWPEGTSPHPHLSWMRSCGKFYPLGERDE